MTIQIASFNIALLDKIIALYAWSPQSADWVVSLAERRETYSVNMGELERWVKQSKEDKPNRGRRDASP